MENFEKSLNIFKALGDSTRLRIVTIILEETLAVSTIASKMEMTQSAVSHQLQFLKLYNIVKNERKGREVYYSLADCHVKRIIQLAFEHTSHE